MKRPHRLLAIVPRRSAAWGLLAALPLEACVVGFPAHQPVPDAGHGPNGLGRHGEVGRAGPDGGPLTDARPTEGDVSGRPDPGDALEPERPDTAALRDVGAPRRIDVGQDARVSKDFGAWDRGSGDIDGLLWPDTFPPPPPPDAAPPPPDAAPPPPDAPPPPPDLPQPVEVQLQVDQGPSVASPVIDGRCGVALTLTWQSRNATTCHLDSVPPGFVSEALSGASVDAGPWGDSVVFTLVCGNVRGDVSADAPVAIAPILAPTVTLDRGTVEAVQRQCAARHRQTVMSNDSAVHADDTSAAQICRCAGYASLLDSNMDSECYYSPGDNGLAHWDAVADNWVDEGAARAGNHCIEQVQCEGPANTCGALY